MGEGPAPLGLQARELPPLQSLFSFVARVVSGHGLQPCRWGIELIGVLYLFMFTVSHGGVEQVFRPAGKLINPHGFSR